MSEDVQRHVLECTSPELETFIGKCVLYGMEGLPISGTNYYCPQPRKVSQAASTPPEVEPVADGCHQLDTPSQVFFSNQDFYVLSNFSAFSLRWKGLCFDTSEAAYHWEKFPNEDEVRDMVREAPSAHERSRSQRAKICFAAAIGTP
jgi:hypothetical protein